jgi:hypothetical protein
LGAQAMKITADMNVLVRAVEIAETVRRLLSGGNVAVNRSAAEAGLALLDAGGDFAEGVAAFEGNWLGAETFISFDAQGKSARLLS